MTRAAAAIMLCLVLTVLMSPDLRADDLAGLKNTYQGTCRLRDTTYITDGELTIQCAVDFLVRWKFWTIFGEPVEYYETAWQIVKNPRIRSAPFLHHYEISGWGLDVPEEILRKIRIYDLDFAGYLDAGALPYYQRTEGTTVLSAQVVFDAGVMGPPYVGTGDVDGLPADVRKRYYSYNTPGSPEWENFFCVNPRYNSSTRSIERLNLSRSTALAIYRSGIPSMDLWLLHVAYDLSAVKEWLLGLERTAAVQAKAETGSVEAELRRVRQEGDQLGHLTEEKRRQIAARPAPASVAASRQRRKGSTGSSSAALNLLLLIDVSGSMNGSKLASAKRAAVESVKTALGKNMRAAVWSFSGGCSSPSIGRVDLTRSQKELTAFIESLRARGGTPLYGALEKANEYLQAQWELTGTPGMIVLLADGEDGCGNRFSAVSSITGGKVLIRHEIIGLGIPNGSEAYRQLTEIAHLTGGKYHGAVRNEELGRVLSSVLAGVEMLDMFGHFGDTDSRGAPRADDAGGTSGTSMDSIMNSW